MCAGLLQRFKPSGEDLEVREINVTDAKNRLTELVKAVEETTASFVIMRNGRRAAILFSPKEYESFVETIEVLQDRKLMKQLVASAREFSRGKGVPFSTIRRDV